MTKQVIQADLTEFAKSARKHIGVDWPVMVVSAFGAIAEHAQDSTRALTRFKFDLHSNYITDGIRHFPATSGQRAKAESALKKYGDMNAAVYVRPFKSPKHSLRFMVDHEEGETREAHAKAIAVPTPTLKAKGYRNNKGKTKRSFKPKHLLERFGATGSQFKNGTTVSRSRPKKRKRLPGSAFMITGKSGKPFIARAISRGKGEQSTRLEFLYMLVPSVRINKAWGFTKNVWDDVAASSFGIVNEHAKRMPSYGGRS